MVILKAKIYNSGWIGMAPQGWQLQVSLNGWKTDEIGQEWLETQLIPLTRGRMRGPWIMLLMDGHGSQITPNFDGNVSKTTLFQFSPFKFASAA